MVKKMHKQGDQRSYLWYKATELAQTFLQSSVTRPAHARIAHL